MAHVCVTTVSNLTHVCATHAYITSTLRNLLYSAVSRKIKNAETVIVSAFCGVFHDTKVIRLRPEPDFRGDDTSIYVALSAVSPP